MIHMKGSIMSPESRHHMNSVCDLPPPFNLVKLREVGDAFVHARTHAAELGAWTLISVGRAAYPILAMTPERVLRIKLRNLLTGLAIQNLEAVA